MNRKGTRKETPQSETHLEQLIRIAYEAMRERGLAPAFPSTVIDAVRRIDGPERPEPADRDLRALPWSSIDNDDSEDLDQLSVALPGGEEAIRVLVAIADVDGLVPLGSVIDRHAYINTTSVYPPGHVFPMLPERLSTDLTSLDPGEDRVAIVTEMEVDGEGRLVSEEIYRAYVRNHAKLAYNTVGPWLEEKAPVPTSVASVPGLAENLKLQNRAAKRLRRLREENGALNFETVQGNAIFKEGRIVELRVEERNDAKDLIEDLMIAANGVAARTLKNNAFPTLRRVVKTPKRWERIVSVAESYQTRLPKKPDSKALNAFLEEQRQKDPRRFPDLSLTIIKLLGSGEYVAEKAGESGEGHFGLAVKDYAHSTAPNRRYPDLITQRLLKAFIAGGKSPYTFAQLTRMAERVTKMEDDAAKVERKVYKAAAALLLQDRIGETFDGVVTGAAEKGYWVRLLSVPVEGKIVQGGRGIDVGDFVRVALVSVDAEAGFLDFRRVPDRRP